MNCVWDRKVEELGMLLTECSSAIEFFKALPVKQLNCFLKLMKQAPACNRHKFFLRGDLIKKNPQNKSNITSKQQQQ